MQSVPAGCSLAVGVAILLYMLFGWFGDVIRESEGGVYSKRVDISFRWGMGWFIFSEVMFFAAFFGTLFYVRTISVPELGNMEHKLLWPDFRAMWPKLGGAKRHRALSGDGRLWPAGLEYPDPADVGRDADLGTLGADEEQPQPAQAGPAGYRTAGRACSSVCRSMNTRTPGVIWA